MDGPQNHLDTVLENHEMTSRPFSLATDEPCSGSRLWTLRSLCPVGPPPPIGISHPERELGGACLGQSPPAFFHPHRLPRSAGPELHKSWYPGYLCQCWVRLPTWRISALRTGTNVYVLHSLEDLEKLRNI